MAAASSLDAHNGNGKVGMAAKRDLPPPQLTLQNMGRAGEGASASATASSSTSAAAATLIPEHAFVGSATRRIGEMLTAQSRRNGESPTEEERD